MGAEHLGQWHAAAASTLDWWHEAGVDVLVDDQPRDWLTPEIVVPPTPIAPTKAEPASLPATLSAFLGWRAGADAPEAAWAGACVAASGPDTPALMVLVDCPDRGDDTGLLSGRAGQLFDRMLAAIGLTRADVHLAAVCTKRPTSGRLPREIEAELHRLARHHLGLVAPPRLLLMGDAASRAGLGIEVLRARGALHVVKHDRGETAAVATFHPRLLLERPAQKADAWKDLQVLMRDA